MIKPILYRMVLKLDEVEKKTQGGIIIPEEVSKRERRAVEIGTVIALGPTCYKDYDVASDYIKPGDRVVIAKYSGKDVTDVDDKEYVIINDVDVLCILRGDEE